jgi:hypothetical protein
VQLNQLKERLTVKNMTYEVLADACSSKRTIETFVVKWNKRLGKDQNLTILMLNNTTQITKLSKLVDKLKFTKINVFVDEGDTLNKYDCAHYNDKGKTQDLWEEFFDAHEARVFKVFITATPENVIAIQKVTRENILLLPVPSTYRKVTELHPWEGNIESVQGELDRIRALKNGEFILYVDEVYKSSHEYYAREFSVLLGCVTVGYNGDGVIAYINGESCGNYGSISSCLSAIKPLALMKGLIVIGAKLINRGISFVGSDMDEPMAASVMFLVPSKKPYCVATAQILGRVTGTGRSDITRRVVYCTQKVIKAYTDYLHNQELIFNGPSGFSGLKNPDAKDPGIPLDRPFLSNTNQMYRDTCKEWGCIKTSDTIDGVKLSLIPKWIAEDTIIGKMFRFIYSCEGVITWQEFKSGVGYTGSDEQFMSLLRNGASKIGKIWRTLENHSEIYMNPHIRAYVSDNKLI